MNIRRLLVFCLAVFMICPVPAQENIIVCYNGSTTVSFSDASTTDKYLWQTKTNSTDWQTVKNWSIDKFVDLDNLTNSLSVRYLVDTITFDAIPDDTVDIATITVYEQFTAGTISTSQTICYNTLPSQLTGTNCTGGAMPYSYQWQYSTDGSNFTNISDATSLNYMPSALTQTTWYRLLYTSSSDCGTVFSNVIQVTVRPQFLAGMISGDQTICYNTAPLQLIRTSDCTGGDGSYSYQWQSSTNGTTFTNINGATGINYQPAALSQTTDYRLAFISGSDCGTVYSLAVRITVRPQIEAGTITGTQTICYNTTPDRFVFTTSPGGAGGAYTYQWFESDNASTFTAIPSATYNTYQAGNLTATKYYKVAVTSTICGTTDESNVITVTVRQEFLAGNISSPQTICYNTVPAQLTSTECSGGDGTYTYQWQESTDGTNFSNASGTGDTSLNFTPDALAQTTYFRLRYTSGSDCGTQYSNEIIITVYPDITAAVINTTTTNEICYNDIPSVISIQTPASGGNGTFTNQWQVKNGTVWTDIAGETGTFYQPGNLTVTTLYRLKSTSVYGCGDVLSNEITINVYSEIDAGIVSGTQTICYNTTPSMFIFTTTPSGAGNNYTYQWFESDNALTFTAIPSATNNTYQAGDLTATKYYKVTVTSTICGTTDESNVITVTVHQPFVTGTISGLDTICASTQPNQLSMTVNCSGGDNSYSYQWQKSTDAVNFRNINEATNTFYQPSLLTETTYFRLQFTSGSGCGTLYSNPVEIFVYPLPLSKDLVGDLIVCRNMIDVNYSLSTDQENIDYQWYITGGEITSDPNSNNITVHWGSTEGSGMLTLVQTNILTHCQLNTEYTIEITEDYAPNKTRILKKQNSNILICKEATPGIHYTWGFVDLNTQEEQIIPNSDYQYVQLPHLMDTTKYDYFVDLTYGNKLCTTRTLYLKDEIHNTNPQTTKLKVYPNPAKGHLSVAIQEDIKEDFIVSLNSIWGQAVFSKQYRGHEASKVLNFDFNLPPGVYYFVIQTKVEVLTRKVIIE